MSERYVKYCASGEVRISNNREVKNPDLQERLSNACTSLPQALITVYRSRSSMNMTEPSGNWSDSFCVAQRLINVVGWIIPVE